MSRKAAIERGMILEATEDGYLVASLDRLGIVSPPIPTIQTPELSEGDKVYFFLFQDGTGGILSLLTPDGRPSYVLSVNGKTGQVELDASDVGALPDDTVIPTKVSDLANDSAYVDAAGAAAAAPVKSVNGQTGAVSVPVPTKVSDLTNDSAYVDAAGAAAAAPVQSVNGQTGAVSFDIPSGVAVQDDAPTDDELVWVDTDDSGAFYTIPEVDDDSVSSEDTWSSQKIDSMFSSGTDNGWTYIKIGTKCVAFYYNQITGAAVTTQWVTGTYRSGELYAAPFPTFLKSGYRVFGAGAAGSQDSGVDFGRIFISSDAIRMYLSCTQSKSNCSYPLMVVAVGDWNE